MIHVSKGMAPSAEDIDNAFASGDVNAGRMYENVLIQNNRDKARQKFNSMGSDEVIELMEYGGCELTLIEFIKSEFPEIAQRFVKLHGGLYIKHKYPYANVFAKHNVPGFKEYLMKLPQKELKKYNTYPEVSKYIQKLI
jgi:tetrahydromethanopterin S-methyltransferase subunit H